MKAFEKLIGIVHDRALAANKNRAGIKGMGGAGGGGAGSGGQQNASGTVKLGDASGDQQSPDANACGC